MKIDDIFFAIGIIVISSLLVFVVYDDIMNPYPVNIYEDMEIDVSDGSNLSENDTRLVPASILNDTNNKKVSVKTKTTNTQSFNGAVLIRTSDTKTSSVQNSKAPEKNVNNNIKSNSRDFKPQSSNNPNNQMKRQDKPNK